VKLVNCAKRRGLFVTYTEEGILPDAGKDTNPLLEKFLILKEVVGKYRKFSSLFEKKNNI
jgi:hypothetical protein